MVSKLWIPGCCIMFHMNWLLIVSHHFVLVPLRCNLYTSHTSKWCIYSLWTNLNGNFPVWSEFIFPVNSTTTSIILFYLSWMMINFSSQRGDDWGCRSFEALHWLDVLVNLIQVAFDFCYFGEKFLDWVGSEVMPGWKVSELDGFEENWDWNI